MKKQLHKLIKEGAISLGLQVSSRTASRFCEHLFLLKRWNKIYNLTAINDPNNMVVKHVLDSIAITPYLKGEKVIDVGTGAGFPGIPLAILLPNMSFCLLDSNRKKTQFLTEIKAQLNLENVTVINGRVEEQVITQPYDMVVCRAYGSLEKMILTCSKLVGSHGRLMSMKAKLSESEITTARYLSRDLVIHRLKIPNLESPRHLVEITPSPKT